jgi:hypothetical protein
MGNLTINLVWDSNALAAPQSFRTAVQDAANVLEGAIDDPITVNIAVGYTDYDVGGPQYTSLTDGYSLGGVTTGVLLSYPALLAALADNPTSAGEVEAVQALPNAATLDGDGTFLISTAEAKALGALPANDTAIDGYIGFPASFTGNGLIDAAIVELAHALGLLNNAYQSLNFVESLIEYTGVGQNLLTSDSSTPAYFSVNGGVTDLANADVGFDSTLFSGVSGDPLSLPNNGVTSLTPLDETMLSVLGFDTTSTPTLPTPSITPTVTAAGGSTSVTGQSVTLYENSAISLQALIASVSVPSGDAFSYQLYDGGSQSGGYFEINGVAEADGQSVYVLDTQLSLVDYVAGTTPGTQYLYIAAYDATTDSNGNGASVAATTVAPPPGGPVADDFTGNGLSDVLWEYEDTAKPSDPNNGQVGIWLMNGTTPTATPVIAQVPGSWQAVTTGDFNGDGMADILWKYDDIANPSDPNNGSIAIWMMNGTTPTSEQVIQQAPLDWQPIATGDFTGNGIDDIVWEYENTANPSDPSNGQVAIWLMNDGTPYTEQVIAQVPAHWQIITTGDFSGNGKSDLLWEYENTANPADPNNGEVAIWMMNGTTPVSEQIIAQVPASWHAIATGDFSGNGMDDIVWEYNNSANPLDPNNGDVAIWMMDGAIPVSTQVIQQVPASWQVVTTGDFYGTGKDDIVWQNTANGQAAIWQMNGPTPTAETVFATPPAGWHVIPG